nr:fibrillin-1-like [Nomia melanderi]
MIAVAELRKGSFIFLLAAVLSIFRTAAAQLNDPPIPCKSTQDCVSVSAALKDASCQNGFCACSNGAVVRNCSSIALIRTSNRNAGSPGFHSCKVPQDCIFNNSFCNTTVSRCECQRDYVWSDNKKLCLKKAEAMEYPCVDDKQCLAFLPNTTCKNERCSCIDGSHFAVNACYKTIALGDPCTRSEECANVAGAICTDREVCDCSAGTVINSAGSTCLPVAKEFLAECEEDNQCIETFSQNAACVDQVCRCRDRYHFEPEMNRCFVNTELDGTCGNSYECYQASEANRTSKGVQCVKNVCVCAKDFYREDDACIANEGSRRLGSLLLAVPLAAFALFHGI